jgi:Holliday junction resolvasome RuvABC DNA-binding subunit
MTTTATDTRYNGWTNYATWRINLEIFDGYETEYPLDRDSARAMVEELIEDTTTEGIGRDYAMAFLSGVNWQEIAEHVNEANNITDEE